MVSGEVTQTRMEPADRGPCAIASITSFVGRKPCIHGIADERCDWPARTLRPRSEGPGHVVRELNLHTCHVQTVASLSIHDGMASYP